MATGSVIRQFEALFQGGSMSGLSDRQLIERFTTGGSDPSGQAAFAAMVARHGPMVLSVCRQLLGDVQHAEDALQAVFLVLARKARSIRDPDRLGNWLYGVAVRTSRCARQQVERRRRHEESDAVHHSGPDAASPADRPAIDREQAEALHVEIGRLPGAFRSAVVLCYFEGLTLDEAARRLRCPPGTLRSRLARAREKLRIGLTRRGVVLPGAAVAVLLDPRSASASIPPLLCDSTTRAAIAFATRHAAAPGAFSAPAAVMAQEVLRTMMIHKLKAVALSLVLLVTVASGALSALAPFREGEPPGEPIGQQARTEPRPPDPTRPTAALAPGRMTVVGRVLDPAGQPVARVAVDVVGRPRRPWVGAKVESESHVLVGRGETDTDGRFRFDAARTASTRFFEIDAMAAAPGFGLGWLRLNPDADQPGGEIRLTPEQVIRGRIVDIKGQPVAGLPLQVHRVGRFTTVGTFDGVNLGESPPFEALHAWLRPVKTDEQGRFTLAGIGRDCSAALIAHDLRFAHGWLNIQTDDRRGPREATLVLQPSTIIEGRVLADDTGQPIPDAGISVAASRQEIGDMYTTHFRADRQGRYTANPSPGKYFRVSAFPPEGQPYLIPQLQFAWAKGTVKRTLDIRLCRGVLIRGQVTDEKTGRPLAGASVQYHAARKPDNVVHGWQAIVATKDDGSFQITVAPGKGHLFVYGPTTDYILESIGSRMLYQGQPGGERYYAHRIIPYDFKVDDHPEAIAATLRPGKTVKGHVVGPRGETVDRAEIIALLHFNDFHLNWRGDLTVHVRDGRFELHGLDPEKATKVSFLDAEHEWGTTVELAGQQAGEDVTIRLQPCGTARARLVGPRGQPVARIFPHLEILGSPGPDMWTRDPKEQAMLAADAAYIVNLDRKHYWRGLLLTDADGRITLPDLIPGATYRISDTSDRGEKGVRIRTDFTVKPGETLDLGDILIEKPPS